MFSMDCLEIMDTEYYKKMIQNGRRAFPLVMDHDHVLGFFRSLICQRCNILESTMPRELSPQVLEFPAPRKPPRVTLPWLCGSQHGGGKQRNPLQKPRSMHSQHSLMYKIVNHPLMFKAE